MSHVIYYYLTMLRFEGRGNVSPAVGKRRYRTGTVIQISARPYKPYVFSYWLIDNLIREKSNIYTITMSMNHIVKAVFAKGYTLTINIEPTGAGTVTKSPDKPLYEAGEVVTVNATAAPGFLFKGWLVDGVDAPGNPIAITI